MVFQRPNPLPISIYENVLFGVRLHMPRRHVSRTKQDEMVEVGAPRRAALGRCEGPPAAESDHA